MLPETTTPNADKLKTYSIYIWLHQLTLEPTRATPNSQTLIDLCVTNSSLTIGKSGVIQLSISDHALVYDTKGPL